MSMRHQIKELQEDLEKSKKGPITQEIEKIEEELGRTKYNKATQGHIGRLKAKLAKLRAGQQKIAKTGKKGLGYAIKKQGDATVVLVGFPSAGKSTLLNQLSNAESKIGDYDFTTLNVVPGTMELNSARVQVLDVPGFIEGASEGRGRGKEVLSILRAADLILIVLDGGKDYGMQLEVIEKELQEAGFRLNQEPPRVVIKKKNTGGLQVGSAVRLKKVTIKTLEGILKEFKVLNAEVAVREDLDIDRFIDALAVNRRYVPALVLMNKSDLLEGKVMVKADMEISGLKGTGLERLREIIWDRLGLMRVYMKKAGKEPDLKEPLILKRDATVLQVAERFHKELAKNIKHARIWGSGKFPGQKVGKSYVLRDRDVVELHF